MIKKIKKYLLKLFGANSYVDTTLSDSLKPTRTPLENRLSLEAEEIGCLIDYLMHVRESLNYESVINAADVKVTSQEVLRAAEHAKMLAYLVKDTENDSIDKIKECFISKIVYAGKKGYYGAVVFFDYCIGVIDKETYVSLAHNSRIFRIEDYYKNLIKSVNMYVAIKDLQQQGFKFRMEGYELLIFTDDTVADELIIDPKYLSLYKVSKDIEPLLKDYEVNAKKLYDEFPEFFSPELKRRFNFA